MFDVLQTHLISCQSELHYIDFVWNGYMRADIAMPYECVSHNYKYVQTVGARRFAIN